MQRSIIYSAFAAAAVAAPAHKPLVFNADGTFQISIFEDLHFGEST